MSALVKQAMEERRRAMIDALSKAPEHFCFAAGKMTQDGTVVKVLYEGEDRILLIRSDA